MQKEQNIYIPGNVTSEIWNGQRQGSVQHSNCAKVVHLRFPVAQLAEYSDITVTHFQVAYKLLIQTLAYKHFDAECSVRRFG